MQLNEGTLRALAPPEKGSAVHWFSEAMIEGRPPPRGFGVVVTAGGTKSFVLNYRVGAIQRRYTIGRWPDWSALRAVREARGLRQRIDRGEDPLAVRVAAKALADPPVEAPAERTIADMLNDFVRLHVEKRLRRPDNYTAAFERLVKPAIGSVPVYTLRRSHIATMLNEIAGDVMADRALAYFTSALNWQAAQDDEFTPPRLTGLRRVKGGQGRERVLDDAEIRAIWRAAERAGTFGAVVRFLLLTGQRRGDVYGMAWGELDGSTWTIPAARYKTGRDHVVPLSKAARAIIEAQPRNGPLVFSGRDGKPLSTGGNRKRLFDKAITTAGGTPLQPWTVHDLRRTARTLMGRSDVRPDIAERVVGHAVGNAVAQIYDRHRYLDEKRDALEALAAMIERILQPTPDNVVNLRAS